MEIYGVNELWNGLERLSAAVDRDHNDVRGPERVVGRDTEARWAVDDREVVLRSGDSQRRAASMRRGAGLNAGVSE
mgnify:CR=1 FL=1